MQNVMCQYQGPITLRQTFANKVLLPTKINKYIFLDFFNPFFREGLMSEFSRVRKKCVNFWKNIKKFFDQNIFWPKSPFSTKIFFDQNRHFRPKFCFFYRNFSFSSKILFFDRNFTFFAQNFIFWSKFYFFGQNFVLWSKFYFFAQNFVFFDQNFHFPPKNVFRPDFPFRASARFWSKFRLLAKLSIFGLNLFLCDFFIFN